MARIHDLLRQLRFTNVALADDIEREVDVLGARRAFGLNFERHTPEAVELPGRPVRTGDKVHVLPPRGEIPKAENEKLWRVVSISGDGDHRVAELESHPRVEPVESDTAPIADLVVVAEFRDPIYPGLVSTGKVERGGEKPFHTVINGENYHALQTLLFTHRGKVDAIYIDPPYNTRDNDWKYNNNYVNDDDLYKHSKWLAFMERRLLLARELLNPADSVLVVTIDEKEYLRLGLLIEQVFTSSAVQMVTSVTAPSGQPRANQMSRVEEYIFVVYVGAARVGLERLPIQGAPATSSVTWESLVRRGTSARRADRENQFYPLFVDPNSRRIVSIGDPLLPVTVDRSTVVPPAGLEAVWPLRSDGTEGRWRVSSDAARRLLGEGFLRLGRRNATGWTVTYVLRSDIARIDSGDIAIVGTAEDGSAVLARLEERASSGVVPKTVWAKDSHNAGNYGSALLRQMLPGRAFPFPKSLYAVEDTVGLFTRGKEGAVVVDFFAGSGTTAHAVMRLNKQDGGSRVSISVTNNEVSLEEARNLRSQGERPGDNSWEQWGICEYVTKPRIRAAVTGNTPEGDPLTGDYKFVDEFAMADGFKENVEFLTLTYEAPLRVRANRDFGKVAPLLWLRAGSRGRRIEDLPNGWDVAEGYGVIANLDRTDEFFNALAAMPSATTAFVISDDNGLFEAVVAGLPVGVEPVRLYDAYFRNFEIDAMRGVR